MLEPLEGKMGLEPLEGAVCVLGFEESGLEAPTGVVGLEEGMVRSGEVSAEGMARSLKLRRGYLASLPAASSSFSLSSVIPR